MKTRMLIILLAVMVPGSAGPVQAHFGMVIPSDTMIMARENRTVHLTFSFSHPFEGHGMPLARPRSAAVFFAGKRIELQDHLMPIRFMDHSAWALDYPIRRPGVYQFLMAPQPYWEPAEDLFIIHYTKTVIAAFGDEQNWDAETGMKAEIVPLTRPFGLYAGNVFRAIIKRDGRPVPHAMVEIEYYNQDGRAQASTGFMVTQTVKSDGNGIFCYAPPVSGWWGFAALGPAGFKLKHDGIDKEVELGAVIWVLFDDWETK
ncbi:MAG: DUF4198 domain-containing protein [Deltaproteobacteria bacterium]|nr:MAG: DUF4198 domain-containing protein [Deltaproteobacteria bacterium]